MGERKLVTVQKASQARDYIERLYVSRKGSGRGLANIEDALIQELENYSKE